MRHPTIDQRNLPWTAGFVIRVGMIALALLAAPRLPASDFQIGTGLAALDETDDRLRPAAMLHMGFGPNVWLRTAVWGRESKAFGERSMVASSGYRFSLFKNGSPWIAGIGLSVLDEQTWVIAQGEDESGRDTEENVNVGSVFGLWWEPLVKGSFYLSAGWESHLYAAGAAGLFLATGRVQLVSVVGGFTF